jgi:hypothetical protein
LIETAPSLEGIADISLPTDLYFGIGLCSRKGLSQGLPVDILAMMLTAEQLSERKTILVADTHAEGSEFDPQDIDRIAGERKDALEKACDRLDLSGWEIVRASEVGRRDDYVQILQSIDEQGHYMRHELADMAWFCRKGAALKLGWFMKGSRRDETCFDSAFRKEFPDERMSFAYTTAGRTFDPKRPKAPPYICTDRTARLLLTPEEDVGLKLAGARERFGELGVKTYMKFLKNLTRTYTNVVGYTGRGPVEEKVQVIIERCCR